MDNNRVTSLKNSSHKARKVFLILFPQVIIYKFKVFILKNFKFNIVVDVIYKYNINFLSPFLLTFINLLANVCHTVCVV